MQSRIRQRCEQVVERRFHDPETISDLLHRSLVVASLQKPVLGFYVKPRYQTDDLRRIFYEECFERVLDTFGRARIMHWLLLGNEVFAKEEVELWVSPDALTVEHDGETLSRYEVEYRPASAGAAGELGQVRFLELFETAYPQPQPRLFGLEEALGDGWLKALRLEEYAPRKLPQLQGLQQGLFPWEEAL